jgi:outer membrane protein OmpA-like peptidoglycan-associated protein
VLLAVALLKDRNGVIDVNLPISGSLNDPQFSVGGIIVKVIFNLIAKALTSPFSLLAGGGSDDLSQVEFLPGTATVSPGSGATIDKVAKALTDRPALKMTVTGASDPASEREAYQQALIDARLVAEQRREALRSGAAPAAAASAASDAASTPAAVPALPADERSRLLKEVYKQTDIPNKPRNVLGFQKDIPPAEMEALLKTRLVVTEEAMRELALQRGIAVRDALIAKGLPSERLFLAAPKLRVSGEEDAKWTPRVQLSLSTN